MTPSRSVFSSVKAIGHSLAILVSHTSWILLRSDAAEPIQGWYASGETGKAHWMYFLFD